MAIEIDFLTHFIQGSTHFSLQLNLWSNEKVTLKSNLKPPMKYFFDCSSFVSNQSVLLVLHYFFLSIFAFFVWSLILFIFPSSPANPKDELQGNIYRKKNESEFSCKSFIRPDSSSLLPLSHTVVSNCRFSWHFKWRLKLSKPKMKIEVYFTISLGLHFKWCD